MNSISCLYLLYWKPKHGMALLVVVMFVFYWIYVTHSFPHCHSICSGHLHSSCKDSRGFLLGFKILFCLLPLSLQRFFFVGIYGLWVLCIVKWGRGLSPNFAAPSTSVKSWGGRVFTSFCGFLHHIPAKLVHSFLLGLWSATWGYCGLSVWVSDLVLLYLQSRCVSANCNFFLLSRSLQSCYVSANCNFFLLSHFLLGTLEGLHTIFVLDLDF